MKGERRGLVVPHWLDVREVQCWNPAVGIFFRKMEFKLQNTFMPANLIDQSRVAKSAQMGAHANSGLMRMRIAKQPKSTTRERQQDSSLSLSNQC